MTIEKVLFIALILHIAAGTVALISGLVAMLATKGNRIHRLAGKVYFGGMTTIFVTALVMAIGRQLDFLLMVAFFSYYIVSSPEVRPFETTEQLFNFKMVIMKKSKFTETQIVKAIQEHEAGRKAEDICRELSITTASFYKWRQRYGGMEASDVKKLKEIQEENSRLKRMYADLSLVHEALKDAVAKKL